MSDEPRTRARRAARDSGIIRHGRLPARGPVRVLLGFIGGALAVVLVSTVAVASIAVWDIARSVKPSIDLVADVPPSVGAIEGPVNLLLVGSDSRDGQASAAGEDSFGTLNDVNILLHISADHTQATAISIPRDMVVRIPDCPGGGGGWTAPMNAILSEGGLPCVALAVSELTGLEIPYAALVGFDGVVGLSNAVGGVDVCVTQPMEDSYTGVTLTAGSHTLSGEQALLFLRSRHGVGDGSDLGRINSQQGFMSSLIRKLKSAGTLSNPVALFSIAKSVTSNMTLSTSLSNTSTLAAMAIALKDIPLDSVTFVEFPGTTGGEGVYAGKVQPDLNAASILFAALQADQAIALTGDTGRGTVVSSTVEEPEPSVTKAPKIPAATIAPAEVGTGTPSEAATEAPPAAVVELPSSVSGQTAAQVTCTVTRSLAEQ